MAYPYTHVTRSNGTILTATIYNTDHQNHIDHNIPEDIDDYSVNATEMQTTTDPGEVGTESLATSLSGELERLRFVLKELKGSNQWYETVGATITQLASTVVVNLTNQTGGGLVAGDVVALDTANNAAVALADTLDSKRRFVVALETIANTAVGKFASYGVVSAKMQGSVTRGNWVRKSATTKALSDSSVASTASFVPQAALGIALEAAADTEVKRIFLMGNVPVIGSVAMANAVAIIARNAANSADKNILSLDASDRTVLGHGGSDYVVIQGQARHDINSGDRFVLPVGTDKWAT